MSKILVVDDEIEITNILGEFLTKKGFRVTQCNNGKEAISALMDDKTIEILVLDNKMDCHNDIKSEILLSSQKLPTNRKNLCQFSKAFDAFFHIVAIKEKLCS